MIFSELMLVVPAASGATVVTFNCHVPEGFEVVRVALLFPLFHVIFTPSDVLDPEIVPLLALHE